VVLQILTEDMQQMIEKFSISYMASTIENDNNDRSGQQQLKVLQENWQQKNNRGHGYYSKNPNNEIQESFKSPLVSPSTLINDGLVIPELPVPNWLNVTIGFLMSIKYIRESRLLLLSETSTPLINNIIGFIHKWMSELDRIRPPKRTSTELMQLSNTRFDVPNDDPVNDEEQLNFIFNNILLPVINYPISAIRICCCTLCKFTVHTRFDINYIPINIIDGKFQIINQLKNYFDGGTSDSLCEKCSMTMSRQIKLLDRKCIITFNSE
jgi:hypothetical protein